jgi:leucyl aminopeptidase
LELSFHGGSLAEFKGSLVACDLAFYNFKRVAFARKDAVAPELFVRVPGKWGEEDIEESRWVAAATNLARHLTNLPPNWLNPRSYAEFVKDVFAGAKHVDVEVWSEKRLKREKMNLILAVGQGAEHPSRMVHIRYRPKDKLKQKPIALVGKGITFDTGGFDLKNPANMRLMKKDMAGSAVLMGVAFFAERFGLARPLDIYLALAENSVGERAFRPSDVVRARNGMTVEINDTDAEGRLVMADVLDVAVSQEGVDEPEAVIDVSTLTGAIKAGLGADVAGLFCNYDPLAQRLLEACHQTGEPSWRMPLFQPYRMRMISPFADMANSVEGFGGAITAALFLESFVRGKPWAHFDLYGWRDKPGGVFAEPGASGQQVQALLHYLRSP